MTNDDNFIYYFFQKNFIKIASYTNRKKDKFPMALPKRA